MRRENEVHANRSISSLQTANTQENLLKKQGGQSSANKYIVPNRGTTPTQDSKDLISMGQYRHLTENRSVMQVLGQNNYPSLPKGSKLSNSGRRPSNGQQRKK